MRDKTKGLGNEVDEVLVSQSTRRDAKARIESIVERRAVLIGQKSKLTESLQEFTPSKRAIISSREYGRFGGRHGATEAAKVIDAFDTKRREITNRIGAIDSELGQLRADKQISEHRVDYGELLIEIRDELRLIRKKLCGR